MPTASAQRGYERGRGSERGRGDERGRYVARTLDDCDRRVADMRATAREHHEGWLERETGRLEYALREARGSWEREHDFGRTRRHIEHAIDTAREINRAIRERHMHPGVHRQWDAVRGELNRLVEVFELPRVGW